MVYDATRSRKKDPANTWLNLEESNGNNHTPLIDDKPPETRKMSWWYQDRSSVLLLLFLYILQGIPLGLAGSIPMLLASKNVDYHQQAIFSFVFWPFSLKLLWAPIVDSTYFAKFGRRKSWLVPTQYCIGLVMLILSYGLDSILNTSNPNILHLTICFFILNFCAATQDIAVDGWALTMLSKKNVGLASTCNSVGQTAGYFLGYVVFLALESADFCNKYLRSEPQTEGVVTLASFMYFWSIVFFITTTFVMLFKKEDQQRHEEVNEDGSGPVGTNGIFAAYKLLWKIICLPNVLQYVIILLTVKVGFASESLVGLKLIESGIHKESLALLAIPMTPLQIMLPLLIAKYTSGPKPLDIFLKAFRWRILFTMWLALLVYITPLFKEEDGTYPYSYFVFVLITYSCHQVALYCMFVSMMAFNAKISDPRIGGTYMTLLNTVANLGGNWPSTLALWFVDDLTTNYCVGGKSEIQYCNKDTKEACIAAGGKCDMSVDGYYIEVVVCVILGIGWLFWKRRTTRRLQELDPERWKCPT
uniref:Acetyl-coenzyme A transporter 1 n=1 Tax=Phallusia mammillata TaxID=59560 RepID=A0A6F9DT78_9ASCI|nr:acetyl-coenzyme A transporter 1 [Phallusia mammillata]